jgi:hypothetical protein
MPFCYKINEVLRTVFVRAEGWIKDHELAALMTQIGCDPRFQPEMRFLSDYTAVTKNELTGSCLDQISTILKYSPKSRRVTLFNPENPADYGLGRMYQAYCTTRGIPPITIAMSRPEAFSILNAGLPPEQHIGEQDIPA